MGRAADNVIVALVGDYGYSRTRNRPCMCRAGSDSVRGIEGFDEIRLWLRADTRTTYWYSGSCVTSWAPEYGSLRAAQVYGMRVSASVDSDADGAIEPLS